MLLTGQQNDDSFHTIVKESQRKREELAELAKERKRKREDSAELAKERKRKREDSAIEKKQKQAIEKEQKQAQQTEARKKKGEPSFEDNCVIIEKIGEDIHTNGNHESKSMVILTQNGATQDTSEMFFLKLTTNKLGELTANGGTGKLYDSRRKNDILLVVPRTDGALIAMNYRVRGARAGASIHHCITEGTKASVAMIFNIEGDSAQEAVRAVVKATSNGDDITNEILSAIEMELFKAREVWLADCGQNGNDFFEFEQRQINYSSLSIYKGYRDDTVQVTLPSNIVKNKQKNNIYEKYLELKLEVELSSPLLQAILNIGGCHCNMRLQYYLPKTGAMRIHRDAFGEYQWNRIKMSWYFIRKKIVYSTIV